MSPLNQHPVPQRPPNKIPMLENIGLIRRMVLPTGWQEETPDFFQARAYSNLRIFSLQNQKVTIRMSKVSTSVSKDDHNSLVLLLGKAPHLLQYQELPALTSIMHPIISKYDEHGNMLVLLSAKTYDVNGKRVLFVVGTYKGTDCHLFSMFWNASVFTSDPCVQHATLEGHGADYLSCLTKVKVAFKTVQWKTF